MQHAMAAVATLGTADQTAFDESSLQNEAITRLRGLVTVQPLEPIGQPPNDRPARVTWEFEDGSESTTRCESARGGPDKPIAEAELRQKIVKNVTAVFPAMMSELDGILDLSPTRLRNSWRDTVAAMVG
jgi:hypothetical protein